MPEIDSDPWTEVRTHHDFAADQVISALQKEIRRGNTENAVLLAHEMVVTSTALEDYLWKRLMVISVEDIGFGAQGAPILINSLHQMLSTFDRGASVNPELPDRDRTYRDRIMKILDEMDAPAD